jgi:hypothetical protein
MELLLFDLPAAAGSGKTCRQCKYRFAAPLHERSGKVLQMCEFKRGRNSCGYKTIKVTDKACPLFSEKKQIAN